jgi:hypothetical protein
MDLLKENGMPVWESGIEGAHEVIDCGGRPGEIDIAYNGMVLSLKHPLMMGGRELKIGDICFLVLSLIRQQQPPYLFSYWHRHLYSFIIVGYDPDKKRWQANIEKCSNGSNDN